MWAAIVPCPAASGEMLPRARPTRGPGDRSRLGPSAAAPWLAPADTAAFTIAVKLAMVAAFFVQVAHQVAMPELSAAMKAGDGGVDRRDPEVLLDSLADRLGEPLLDVGAELGEGVELGRLRCEVVVEIGQERRTHRGSDLLGDQA